MKKIQILLLLVLSLFLGKNPLAQTIQRNIDSPAQAQLDSAHLEESEEEDGQYSRGPQEVACGCPLATYVSCEFDDDQPEGYSRIFLDLEVRGTSCAENINFNFADPGWHPEDHGVVCERNNQLNISIYSLCSFPSGNDRELALPVRIHVFAGGGNDRIDLSGIPSMRWGIQLEDPDGNFYSVNPIDEIEIRGGSGNDNITGSLLDDQIYGEGGNDMIGGLGGNDELYGGAGNDTIRGGPGNDQIRGGPGNNVINQN